MESNPLVSVIVPTRNSSKFLEKCLQSIHAQTYSPIEIIVVDNFSTDSTKSIAKKFDVKYLEKGPERSTQRNYGAQNARGTYVAIIDSDMELSRDVVAACVAEMKRDEGLVGLVIPEESVGEGFWAKCKQFERSFYVGIEWMEAARFFRKDTYLRAGGYNETMVSGEDWEFSDRIKALGRVGRVAPFIYHNEGRLRLYETLKKKTYYATHFPSYTSKASTALDTQKRTNIFARYGLFFSKPRAIFIHPIRWLGMLFMKTCEFVAGAHVYLPKYDAN